MNITTTGTIRQRGQLTLPESIRSQVEWLDTDQPVTISLEENKVVLSPPQAKHVDWQAIWENIHLAQELEGKQGNLAAFVAQDRQRR